jgi:CBS-domain-containing membrane protein/ribosome-associated translation inhibitor RaiA
MRISDLMSAKVITMKPNEHAESAWSKMQQHHIRHLVVVEKQQIVGVLSDRNLGGQKGRDMRRGRVVGDLMTSQVVTASPEMQIRQAANLMRGRSIGCLPVMNEGELVGIVTTTDVLTELGRGRVRPNRRPPQRPVRRPKDTAHVVCSEPDEQTPGVTGRNVSTLGRSRIRKPDSIRRAPMADRIPRPVKAATGRTSSPGVPAYIRADSVHVNQDDRAYLRRKLGMKLGKFAKSIERVSIHIEDINGPRGGEDKVCRIKAVLSGLPSIVVEQRHASLQAAMDRALDRVEKVVRRSLGRRRQKDTDSIKMKMAS